MSAKILVFAEQADGKLRAASLHALSFAKKLAEVAGGGEIYTLVVGHNVTATATELAQFTPQKVFTVDNEAFKAYMAETYAPVVAAAAKQIGATIITGTATSTGKDLFPRVAALLDIGMVSEAIEILGPNSFKRPMIAGNLIATVEVSTTPYLVSARQTAWPAAQSTGSQAPIEALSISPGDRLGAEVVALESVKSERPELADAKVVVSGGRGMKEGANFKHLEVLADIFGGAMGATRAACDAGMVANDLQVGQTGKVVAPNLYVAVGISGAIQHLAGMKNSKVIVAINKDPEAPIFQVADYGLVAKWEDTIPEFTEKVRAIKAAK